MDWAAVTANTAGNDQFKKGKKWYVSLIFYLTFYSAMTTVRVTQERVPMKSCDGRIVSAFSGLESVVVQHYCLTISDWVTLLFVFFRVFRQNCKGKPEKENWVKHRERWERKTREKIDRKPKDKGK